jgi:hypothetical protein
MSLRRANLDSLRDGVSDDTPLRLDVALKAAFPAGGMTVAGLRNEIAKGRLEVELIAGKHFTTLAAIARMREKCRVTPKNASIADGEDLRRSMKSGAAEIALANLQAVLTSGPGRIKTSRRPAPTAKR